MQLAINELTKRFGSRPAVDRVSLESTESEFIALIGPSGCGKTTLLRLIAGLEQADAGDIHLGGRDVSALAPHQRNVAMVFQGDSVYPHLTVRENLAFPLRMRKLDAERIQARVASTAEQFGIRELLDRQPGTLSGGQRQRVALGRAMIREPDVCLLDEPFSHLDSHLRRRLAKELQERKSVWTATTILVTHDLNEAFQLGDRVAIMTNGELHQLAAPHEIRSQPANSAVASFLDDFAT